ncbi:hypothetical protein HO173_009736 [Letharia columbiana]|uniref:Uncharacterized protein n=1 Tax=Letharia columbiana TaxID=112416 RepID=A0A8H6FNW7_9LECA|nr:uncharacterized protein HO173_009736 [Letharia columbiana]KAF6231899.1 hypothetical protein HO173_009736 [Letharia columbiana]
MRRVWALVSILPQCLSAPTARPVLLAVSLPAANRTVNQHIVISVLSSDPASNPSPTLSSLPSNSIALELSNANYSLSLPENSTVSLHFHVPDTLINLTFTFPGRPLSFITMVEAVKLAIDEIATNVGLRPTESITHGFFRQRRDKLEINIHQYGAKQVTWSLLEQLLLGIQYFMSQLGTLCEMRFQIDVQSKGRVGHGSLWYTGLQSNDVVKRAVNETSEQLPMLSISKPALTNWNGSMLSHIPDERSIVFSYHFFGPTIPESTISMCLRLARQSIRTNVQLHPHDGLPDGLFQYRACGGDVSIGIKAYADNAISWLLLDQILHDISRDLIGAHHLLACEFEFEIYPFERPHGHGSLQYDPTTILPAIPSHIAASAVKRTFPQLRYANATLNSPPHARTSLPNPTHTWAVVLPVPGTPITLLVNSLGNPLPLWDVASTLSGARNEVLSAHGTYANLPINNGRFQYSHAGSSVWVRVVAKSEQIVTWQDLNDVLKGLFEFLCTGKKARSRWLLFEIFRDGRGIVGDGLVSGHRPGVGVSDAG